MNRAMWLQRTTRSSPRSGAAPAHARSRISTSPKIAAGVPSSSPSSLINLPGITDLAHQDRCGRGGSHRGPALVPHRRRQDRGISRHSPPIPWPPASAGRGRRARRRARNRRADAVHAAPLDAAADPARLDPDLRVREHPARGTGTRTTTGGVRRRSGLACGWDNAPRPTRPPKPTSTSRKSAAFGVKPGCRRRQRLAGPAQALPVVRHRD